MAVKRGYLIPDLDNSSIYTSKYEVFTATAGQTLFTLTQGTYLPNSDRLAVVVNGSWQPPTAYTQTSSSSFTFNAGLEVGDSVIAHWIEITGIQIYSSLPHASTHDYAKGSDPITAEMVGVAPEVFHAYFNINSSTLAYECNQTHDAIEYALDSGLKIFGTHASGNDCIEYECKGREENQANSPLVFSAIYNADGTTYLDQITIKSDETVTRNVIDLFNSPVIIGDTHIQSIFERVTLYSSAFSSPQVLFTLSNSIHYCTANATSNIAVDFWGNAEENLETYLAVGESKTVVVMVTNGATPYYISSYSVDASSVTPKWLGTAPSAGNANAIDVYTFTIIKTSATPTYTVLANMAKYA